MRREEALSVVIAAILVIAYVDASCGPELSPWAAYMAPVALAGRYCGFATAAFYSVVAGALLGVAAKYSGHPYTSTLYFLFTAASQTLVFLVIAWFASRLSRLDRALREVLASRSHPYPGG